MFSGSEHLGQAKLFKGENLQPTQSSLEENLIWISLFIYQKKKHSKNLIFCFYVSYGLI